VAATIKCRIERHDDRIEAFFDSIDPSAASARDPARRKLAGARRVFHRAPLNASAGL
jgi:hypothetical protein